MNTIVEKRIKQFITTNFLKTESELTLVSFLVKTIEADYKKITTDIKLVDKQIESKQIHVLNTIRNSFSNGEAFLKYFNFKNNNMPFSKLNGMKIMKFVNSLDTVKSTDIITALNAVNVNKTFYKKNKSKKYNEKVSK
jgi:hypothetical protein